MSLAKQAPPRGGVYGGTPQEAPHQIFGVPLPFFGQDQESMHKKTTGLVSYAARLPGSSSYMAEV